MSNLKSGDEILINGEWEKVIFNEEDQNLTNNFNDSLRGPNKFTNVTKGFYIVGQEVSINIGLSEYTKIVEKVIHKDNNLCDVYFVDPYKPRNRKEKRDIKFKR